MITVSDTLKPEHVALDLAATSEVEERLYLASLLRNDARVTRWDKLFESLAAKPPCLADEGAFEVCLHHARTDSVSTMVMSVGVVRSKAATGGGEGVKLRYLFVIGVPQAMSADYLRIVGGIGRVLRDPAGEQALREARAPEQFIAILNARELSS
jgi:mannitol/fructose-specific phosphotransferase system IIA component (Ntr-type)